MYAILGTLIAAFVTSILVYVIGVLEISTVYYTHLFTIVDYKSSNFIKIVIDFISKLYFWIFNIINRSRLLLFSFINFYN